MNVGWAGLGRLGLPCALVLAQHHKVTGYDVSGKPWRILAGDDKPAREEGLAELLEAGDSIIRAASIDALVAGSDIIFVAVQTPHQPRFGGEQPMPEWDRADFDYTALTRACWDICRAAAARQKHVTLVVVSTVLPGTTNRVIRPLLNSYVQLVYSPQFIAMGTTVADFRNPEFVICGTDHGQVGAIAQMRSVFLPVHDKDRLFVTDITTAESIKVLYNTVLSLKLVWANHVMELCHETGADCDEVVDALSLATDRVISPKYMRGGMGDGGACHPRDLIALSWLESRLGMSVPLFGRLANAREMQTEWLAGLVRHHHVLTGHPVVIMGEAYKPGSDLTDGSPALLLRHYLDDLSPAQYDPYTWQNPDSKTRLPEDCGPVAPGSPFVYVIATRHEDWLEHEFRRGSTVLDPFGYIPDQDGVTVVRIGRNR